jgi:cytochrome c-type biogenesis protein CcmE
MEMVGDALEGILRVVRETRAPLVAALWALVAFVVAAILIRRRQDNFGWKLGASLLAFGGAAGALLWWSLQPGASYYFFVDEVAPKKLAIRLHRAPIRVHGKVVVGSLEQQKGTDVYQFWMEGGGDRPSAVIRAHYTGSLPQFFGSGVEIVATGTLSYDDTLDIQRDGIRTK